MLLPVSGHYQLSPHGGCISLKETMESDRMHSGSDPIQT
jgi:hypothetical protein